MKLYGIPNCNTVKKARDWLDANNITYQFHDFKKQGIDEATINNWLTQYPWEKLINRAGLTWRGLDDATKSDITNNASATALMLIKTSVIKRPILQRNEQILALGFSDAEYQNIFHHAANA